MKKKSLYFIIVFYLLLFSGCVGNNVEASHVDIRNQNDPDIGYKKTLEATESNLLVVGMDEKYLSPILGIQAYTKDQLRDGVFFKQKHTHPLTSGCAVLKLVRDAYISNNTGDYLLAKKYLDWMADFYPDIFEDDKLKTWRYDFAHDGIPSGWWSGMANAAIALAFRAGYEVFQDPRYKINYEKAMNGIIQPVKNGGSSLSLSPDANWICEYAWLEVTNDNSLYVLNGSLMALLSIKVMADVTGIEEYVRAYEKSLNGYKMLQHRFFRKDDRWTYYSLNPLVTEATHYAIYEIKLFNALYEFTHDAFYLEDLRRRREIFKESYPILFDREGRFLFSTIGFPNPYWIDLFPVKIDFISKNIIINSVKSDNLRDGGIPLLQRGFISGSMANNAGVDSVVVSVFDGHHNIELYEDKIDSPYFNWSSSLPTPVLFDLNCFYDADCNAEVCEKKVSGGQSTGSAEKSSQSIDSQNERHCRNYVNIKPGKVSNVDLISHYTNNQGRIRFDLKEGIHFNDINYMAIVVNTEKLIQNVSIMVYDEKGNGSSRYYPPITSNENNVLLLSFVGFNDIESLDKLINRFEITIYTSSMLADEKENFGLEVKDVYLLKDNHALFSLLAPGELYLNEKLPIKTADGKTRSSWVAQ